jgi:nitroreductase
LREYEHRPLANREIEQIVEAGRLAPSARNWQPWDFVVVTDPALLVELSAVWRGAAFVARAAAAIAIVSPVPRTSAAASSSITTSGRRRWR